MKLRAGVIAAALLGLLVATFVVGAVGFRAVLAAMESMGWGGFALFCGVSLLIFPVLGGAWYVLAPGQSVRRYATFVWGRQVRDAVSDVLPLSQLGGVVAGAQVIVARGVARPLGYASSIVDLTTELTAQLVYTLYGVGFVVWLGLKTPASRQVSYAGFAGLAAAALLTAGFVVAQRRGAAIVTWLAPRFFPKAIAGAEAVQQALDQLYRNPGRLALSVALHTCGWVFSGCIAWLAARLIGVPIGLPALLAIESLLNAIRSFAFLVPNAIGVQEGTYALLGPMLGLGAESALALSLLKRARDVAIGVPALLVWQAMEGRRLLARGDVEAVLAEEGPSNPQS